MLGWRHVSDVVEARREKLFEDECIVKALQGRCSLGKPRIRQQLHRQTHCGTEGL